MKKKIIVSVINDLVTDQRVAKTCNTLHDAGYEVVLIGRVLPNSPPLLPKPYKQIRMRLLFNKGPLFYAFFNIRLFFYLLTHRADILHANDLDTLLANFLVSKIKNKPLVFDSHEYFTEVPELQHNLFAKKTWKAIERFIVPKLTYCITVNQSISMLFKQEYGIDFKVLRNLPPECKIQEKVSSHVLNLPENKFIILLQGNGINIHRGSEELVEAMEYLDDSFLLLIIGNGDVIPKLKKMTAEKNLQNRIHFIGRLPYDELKKYTIVADLGVTLDKDTNLNYRFSLPNKIFDYIQAGTPVLSSKLPELERIIKQYEVGELVDEVTPKAIAAKIQQMFNNKAQLTQYSINCKKAAGELTWENEKSVLIELYSSIEKDYM
ncbi:MAG: glycosyltransferase [Flavobacteriales bacterium]|nr:glycosyltransferase [Flavobacteriales bacterium]